MKSTRMIILLILLITSCHNPNKYNRDHLKTFDLKELPEIIDLKLSDLGFNDIKYIPLETVERNLISFIMDIKFGEDFFLIKSFNKLFSFSNNGSFISIIGNEGRGPNEFTHIHDFAIDEQNQDIYVVSAWQKSIFIYSHKGEFIKKLQCPVNTSQIEITQYGILCYSINSFANIENSFNLIDKYGRVIHSYTNKYQWKLDQPGTAIFDNENIFYKKNSHVYKKEIYSDTVYEFISNEFKPHIVFEQGKKLLSTQARSDFSAEYLFEHFINQKSLFEFGEYVFYEFGYRFKPGKKNLSNAFIGKINSDFRVLIVEGENLVNDLDNGPNIWPKTIKDNNSVIAWIDALNLKKHVASEEFKKSHPKYPEKKKELEKLANSLKETDNPVLMLVKLKK